MAENYATLQDFVNDYNRNFAGQNSRNFSRFYRRVGTQLNELVTKLKDAHNNGGGIPSDITLANVLRQIETHYSDDDYYTRFAEVKEVRDAAAQAAEEEEAARVAAEPEPEPELLDSDEAEATAEPEPEPELTEEEREAEATAAANRQDIYDYLGLTPAAAPNNSGNTGNATELEWLLDQWNRKQAGLELDVPLVDTDNDGYADYRDAFPNDPTESGDYDNDGVGDNADEFPADKEESVDSDGDGVGDNADELKDDPRFNLQTDKDEFDTQTGFDDFILANSRAVFGAFSVHDYQEKSKSWEVDGKAIDFNNASIKEFNAWRAQQIQQKGRLPNPSEAKQWAKNKSSTVKDQVDKIVAEETKFLNNVRLSERPARKEAILSWISQGTPENYEQLTLTGLVETEGYEDVSTAVYLNGVAGDKERRKEQLEDIEDAIGLTISMGANGRLSTEEINGSVINTASANNIIGSWQLGDVRQLQPGNNDSFIIRYGLPYLKEAFINKYSEADWFLIEKEFADLLQDPFQQQPNGTLRPTINQTAWDSTKTEFENAPLATLWPESTELLTRYNTAVDNAFEEMSEGTTPFDREMLSNLGSSMRLGDYYEEIVDLTKSRQHFIDNATAEQKQSFKAAAMGIYQENLSHRMGLSGMHNPQVRDYYEFFHTIKDLTPDEFLTWKGYDGEASNQNLGKDFFDADTAGQHRFISGLFVDALPEYEVNAYIELPTSFDMDLGVNYDKDRLYMKMPGDDDVGTGKYNHEATVYGQPQTLNSETNRTLFANVDDPSAFPHGSGTGAGYFVDISGGEGKVGDYTMLWVQLQEEPSSLSKFIDKIGPFKAIIQIVLAVTGRPDLALQIEAANVALKVVDGQTLHAEDWASLALFSLQKFGKITMPISEAEAASQAAAQGLAQGTQAYSDFMAIKMAGVGLAGLTGKQTISLIRAAGSGDVKSAILPVLADFGDGWVKSGLGSLGVSDNVINAITPAQVETINEVVSDMAKGATFEEAVSGQALDWLGDSIGDNAKLKQFFSGLEGDLSNMLRVAEGFILNDDIRTLGQYILDTVEEIPFTDILGSIEEDFEGTLKRLDRALNLSGIVENFDEELLQPLEDTINQVMAPIAAKASMMYEDLPDGVKNQLDKLTNDIDTYLDNSFNNLDGPIKEAVRQGLVQSVLGNDGTIAGKTAIIRAFTNELIIAQEIAKLDNSLVDVLTAPVLAAGMRSAISGMLMNNPNIGDDVLAAMTGVAATAITDSFLAGTFSQDFKTYVDNVSGDYDLAVAKREELDALPERGEVLEGEMEIALAERDALLQQRSNLEAAAKGPSATEDDQRAYAALLQDPDFERQLIEANQEVVRVSNQIKELEYDEGVLVTEYDTMLETLTATTKFDPAVQAYQTAIVKDMVNKLAPDFNEVEYRLANNLSADEDAFSHYISEGIQNGVPINAGQYNERTEAAISNITTRALTASGVDISTLEPSELKAIQAHFINFAKEVMPEGMTALAYLEGQGNLNEEQVKANGDAAIAEVFGSRAALDETLVNRSSQDFFRNLYDDDMSDAEIRQRMNDVAQGNITYTMDSEGNIAWGGDGFRITEFSPETGKFETYQYDAGGGTKYLLNEDGTAPLVKEYIQTPIFTDKNTLQESSPLAYVTFLNEAVTTSPEAAWLAETTREYNQLIDMSVSEEEKVQIFQDYNAEVDAFKAEQDLREGYDGIPYSELPWIARIAKDSLDFYQDGIDEAQGKIDELNAITGPLTEKQEADLTFYERQLETGKEGLETFVNVAIRFPAGTANIFNEGVRALGKFAETMPAQVAAEKKRREIILAGGTVEDANAAADAIIADAYKDIDFASVMNNDFSRTANLLESMSFGYLPEVYQEDVAEFWQTVEDAEGVGGKLEALYGELTDKPKVFLVEVIGMEIGQELATLVTSLGVGKVVTKTAGLAMADDVARAVGISTAVTTNRGLEVTEAYSGAFTQAYETSYAELIRVGYSPADAEAKAGEIAVGAGSISILLMSTIPGAKALDTKILSSSGQKALTELGERFVDGAQVVTKETLNEFVQEGGTTAYIESALYNAGVEDRDYMGNIALNSTVSALGAFGTTATIYGIGTPTANGGNTDGGSFNPITNVVLNSPLMIDAINSGDATQVQDTLANLGITQDVSNDLYIDVLNVVDDSSYVTQSEAKDSFARLGVDAPSEADIDSAMALDTDVDLDSALTEYWQLTQGNIPNDTDGDGVYNDQDDFPNDASETTDSDSDGFGDNADVFPNDAAEWLDSDDDGTGDNADFYPDDAERQELIDTDGDLVDDRDAPVEDPVDPVDPVEDPVDPVEDPVDPVEDANDTERLGKYALVADINGDGDCRCVNRRLDYCCAHAFGMSPDHELIEGARY